MGKERRQRKRKLVALVGVHTAQLRRDALYRATAIRDGAQQRAETSRPDSDTFDLHEGGEVKAAGSVAILASAAQPVDAVGHGVAAGHEAARPTKLRVLRGWGKSLRGVVPADRFQEIRIKQ
jgi:hypothetical protein